MALPTIDLEDYTHRTSTLQNPIAASFTADLTYIDSKGQQHVLEYMKFTDACEDRN
ncbi:MULTISPECIES: hypothetical protein [unclassified Pseudomonas]|uniref:hypothetical protein n=1 Tax=unclassified Pseudomonas TaxID=196821 RepID=UPI0032670F2D